MKNAAQKGPLRIAQYKSKFLKKTTFVARKGKTAYISPEFHEKLAHLVFMLGGGKVTMSDYLHSVLKDHFKDFSEEIKIMYNNKNKPIF